MKTETFAMVKPVWSDRYRVGDALNFIEKSGFTIETMKLARLTRANVEAFYADYIQKPFFNSMATFMTSGPVVPMILSFDGDDTTIAITEWRKRLGATDSRVADPRTLRGMYGNKEGVLFQNVAHGSDSVAAFERESALFFGAEDRVGWGDEHENERDEWSDAILAAFPTRSGSHAEYGTAMRMVGNRRSKGELVALVNYLLVKNKAVEGRP